LNARADLDAKAKGPTLAVLGSLPLGSQFEIFARAGILFSKVTLDANTFVSGEGQLASDSETQSANSVDPLFGAGPRLARDQPVQDPRGVHTLLERG
jgi:hypothetical protein